jgi:hypothetical protein
MWGMVKMRERLVIDSAGERTRGLCCGLKIERTGVLFLIHDDAPVSFAFVQHLW